MISKTFTYIDYNGDKRTETFHFNLTKKEMIEFGLDSENPDSYVNQLQELVNSKDNRKIFDAFEKLLLMTYGIKSEDGRKFSKSEEITAEFKETAAFNELIWYFIENPVEFATFVQQALPAGVVSDDDVAKAIEETKLPEIAGNDAVEPVLNVSDAPDFSTMTPEEFAAYHAKLNTQE